MLSLIQERPDVKNIGKALKISVLDIDGRGKILYNYLASNIWIYYAGVAQLVEQLIRNQQVVGSSPISSSIKTAWESCFSLIPAVIFYSFLFDYFCHGTCLVRLRRFFFSQKITVGSSARL